MTTPATRTPVRIARGTYSDLNASLADLQEGEICYATDQNKVYVKEGAALVQQPFAELSVAQTFTAAQRGAYVTLTDAATIATDLSLGNHFQVTLGGNRTLGAPTNVVAGQSGVIRVVQDGSGSKTLAYNSIWKFPGGTVPTLTTTANAVDLLVFHVESATRIAARFIGDVK